MSKRSIILSLLVLAAVIGLGWQQFHSSPEWRQFSWSAVWAATQGAKLGFIAGAVLLIYLSYLLRSLRWRALMTPHGRFWPVLKGTLIGFTGIAFFGRPGELLRPYYIARKHATSVSPQLAVWLLERAFDMGATLVLVVTALLLSPDLAAGPHAAAALRRAVWVLAVVVIAAFAGIALFHRHSQRIIRYARARLAHSSRKLSQRIEHFLHTLAAGTQSLTRRRNLLLSAFYTLSLWMGVAVAVWLIVRCYPGMLPGFSYGEALVLLGFLLVGSIVQLPAIGGGVQVLLVLGLTEVFGAPAAPAASAALLMWLISFYAVAPLGAALAAREGISWGALEREAELAGH
ncbi:MAG: lysylphosphatidylglycerol synthase transmembrane domain-containing protein [Terriglobales bacterium]